MTCAACGATNREAARFCDACGARLTAPDVEAGQARKTVTVVFADLQGSTRWHEHLDPEAVRAFMDRYYASMRGEVERHGGRVVKVIGDGIMAAFGVPEVREDDATRAVAAGAGLIERFAELADHIRAESGVTLSLRVGVNTGEVVVSAADDDVVGDVVNVAARLESAAEPGTVLVGDETWRLVRDVGRFDAVAPLMVKNRDAPVIAHRLISLRGLTETSATPFVGRESELDERYIAGEGAPCEALVRAGHALVEAANQRDWDAFAALHTRDVVSVDHEPVHGGVLHGSVAIVESNRAMADLTAAALARIEAIERISPSTALIYLSTHLTTLEGERYDTAFVCVAVFDGARFSRFEWFPVDQLEAARARFDELTEAE
jgi:class 3 adenylate cyclase